MKKLDIDEWENNVLKYKNRAQLNELKTYIKEMEFMRYRKEILFQIWYNRYFSIAS